MLRVTVLKYTNHECINFWIEHNCLIESGLWLFFGYHIHIKKWILKLGILDKGMEIERYQTSDKFYVVNVHFAKITFKLYGRGKKKRKFELVWGDPSYKYNSKSKIDWIAFLKNALI